MIAHTGWLLDIYAHPQDGGVVWLLEEDGRRRRLRHDFPVSFYAAGASRQLRALERFLEAKPIPARLERTERNDLFDGRREVLAVHAQTPLAQESLFRWALRRFPGLDYYDADLPLSLRYGAAYGVFPLGRCRIEVDEAGDIRDIQALDSPWELDPQLPELRCLRLVPDADPSHRQPTSVIMHVQGQSHRLSLAPERALLVGLGAILRRYDPDLVLSDWGDTWLFPLLLELAKRHSVAFTPNRDTSLEPRQRQEHTYRAYGQTIHRGRQVQFYGRWHIDRLNAVMYAEYGLEGVLEQARLTGLPVQTSARKSPGAGITAMQVQVALRREVMVPYRKPQAEYFKRLPDLISLDQGGLVYQPVIGLHQGVAEIDFISMYPSIMAHFNISPETVRRREGGARLSEGSIAGAEAQAKGEASTGTEGGMDDRFEGRFALQVDHDRVGLTPETIRPLVERRVALKARLATLDRRDCRYAACKARVAALKWLLVVCFGYLGFNNARFGRIEAHQAVTAYGREALLRAKEAAEDLGYRVLHMYVDGLWVQREGLSEPAELNPLLDEIARRTGLPIALEGIYRWIAFLPSRLDERVPVANRYFGAYQDGSLKVRGIETRRRDTPAFIARAQSQALELMAEAEDIAALQELLPEILDLLRRRLGDLRGGRARLVDLLVTQRLSRPLDAYRQPSPAARAAQQLLVVGKAVRPGQSVRFLYTLGDPGVYAWDLPVPPNPDSVDLGRYTELLLRAASSVLEPLGLDEAALRDWLLNRAAYLGPLGELDRKSGSTLPLFGGSPRNSLPGLSRGKDGNQVPIRVPNC
jgi:DNA polymerase-2